MKDRIKQLMLSQNLTQQNFSEKTGLSPASLSSIFTDRTKPTLNHVDAIKRSFPNINLDWLLFGKGDMFLSSGDGVSVASGASDEVVATSEPSFDFGYATNAPLQSAEPRTSQHRAVYSERKPEVQQIKIFDKPQRQITEIRIFYDDQTWETFVPKK